MTVHTETANPHRKGGAKCLIRQQMYSQFRYRKLNIKYYFAKKVIKNSASVKKFNTLHILGIFLI